MNAITDTKLPELGTPMEGGFLIGAIRLPDGPHGIIKAPATDEAFMREYIRYWKELMKTTPNLAVQREP